MSKHFLSVEKVGLLYILFRIIHWLVESYKGTLRSWNFLTYLNYLFFFPTFMAGSIDTFNNFHYWVNTTRVRFNLRMLLAGIGRIFFGAVKIYKEIHRILKLNGIKLSIDKVLSMANTLTTI